MVVNHLPENATSYTLPTEFTGKTHSIQVLLLKRAFYVVGPFVDFGPEHPKPFTDREGDVQVGLGQNVNDAWTRALENCSHGMAT